MPTDNPESNLDPLWGARAIGAVLKLKPRQAFNLLERGAIPCAKKIGKKWTADKAELIAWYRSKQGVSQ